MSERRSLRSRQSQRRQCPCLSLGVAPRGARALWLCCVLWPVLSYSTTVPLSSLLSHEAAEDAHLPPVHAEQRARLHPCRLQPGRVQFALLSHREELAAHEITADRRGGAPGS